MKKITPLSPSEIIKFYHLQPHPEGGYFREHYRSTQNTLTKLLDNTYAKRSLLTCCYYLLLKDQHSQFHRLPSAEIWNLHLGGPLELSQIDNEETVSKVTLGLDLSKEHVVSHIIPRDTWFQATNTAGAEYTFVSCVVSPGFEFSDWELATGKQLERLNSKLLGFDE